MTEINGLVNSVQRVARGSELVTAAASGATVLSVDSAEDFDNAGGDLEVNGVRYAYTSSDIETDTITLAAPGLTAAGAVSDSVLLVLGGQVAVDHIAYVTMGEGDEAEVVIPYADRTIWPEGFYTEPVPVMLSSDLTTIAEVPGRVPVIDGTVVQTSSTGSRVVLLSVPNAGGAVQFFTGMDDEVPGLLTSGLTSGGRAALTLECPTLPTDTMRPYLFMIAGDGTTGTPGAEISLNSPKVDVTGRLRVFATLNTDQILPYSSQLKLGDTATAVRADGTWKFGTSTVNITALNTVTSLTVAFSTPFASATSVPVVNLTVESNNPDQLSASVASVSRSGFIIRLYRNAGATGNVDVHWTALAGPI